MDDLTLLASLRPAMPEAQAQDVSRTVHGRLTAGYDTPPRRRGLSIVRIAGPAVGAAAIAAAVVIAGLAGQPGAWVHTGSIVTAAWSVQINHDRTVTITVSQLRDPAGLEHALREDGIPAIVRYVPMVTVTISGTEVSGPACQYQFTEQDIVPASTASSVIVSPSGLGSSPVPAWRPGLPQDGAPLMIFTIRPWKMPTGSVLFIQDDIPASGPAAGSAGLSLLASAHLPRCTPLASSLGNAGK